MSETEHLSFSRRYLFSLDHKTIGKQYLFLGMAMALLGGLMAYLIRWQLAWPGSSVPGAGVLAEPFVHLALDPEWATRGSGLAPGEVIGTLGAADVNAVQQYLAGIVRRNNLPPKALILHQFLGFMLTDTESYLDVPEVEVVIDMDGFGPPGAKLAGYDTFSLAPYAERPAIKLFYDWDEPIMEPDRIQGLDSRPDLVIYQ